ncbi:MAG: MarR family transcriptional regulator [Bacteroidetes bacterium]|nr:MarR family transcriptional regulator [Bacteroidota bacterium]
MEESPRDKSIGAHMAIALQLMKRKNHQAIVKSGYKITMEQLAVLEMLVYHGDMNMTSLSETVWKQNANITRIVDKLEKRELVKRKSVEGDRRSYLISITEKGKKLFQDVLPVVFEVYEDVMSCISKNEEAVILRSMKKIIAHLSDN